MVRGSRLITCGGCMVCGGRLMACGLHRDIWVFLRAISGASFSFRNG